MLRKVINKILGRHHVNESGQEFLIVEIDVDKYHCIKIFYITTFIYQDASISFLSTLVFPSEPLQALHLSGSP